MPPKSKIHINRRFQRAVNIDTDYNNVNALEGFICTKSSAEVLRSIGQHVSETGQGAFTWTGPYGSGKSSLAVVLSALLGGNEKLSHEAMRVLGEDIAQDILQTLPPKSKGWITLPVIGCRDDVANVIGESLEKHKLVRTQKQRRWSDKKVVDEISRLAIRHPRSEGGIILFIDEMGKFLETATLDGNDVYLFQMLAEVASNSNGRFIFIGILHQSFGEYASRLSQEMHDEWSKIQGRFIDLTVNAVGEEQLEMIAHAIQNNQDFKKPTRITRLISSEIQNRKPSASQYLPNILERCWPLHPVVACLIGPISRRRFAQNQRSIFGFLNSAEPWGFQDFIKTQKGKNHYEPDNLWDYLHFNLEPAILASPDGHRWAMATEAIDRCEARGGDVLQIKLLKSISLIDLFKERSGLMPSFDVIRTCAKSANKTVVKDALKQLQEWSLIVFRKFTDSYAIYAGSDFDIDDAVRNALAFMREVDFRKLQSISELQPILAKRHYHETGALRWFDVEISPVQDLSQRIDSYQPNAGIIGLFLLAVPTFRESEEKCQKICKRAIQQSTDWDVVIGLSKRAWFITNLARDLIALNNVLEEYQELPNDAVAQCEIHARRSVLQGQIEEEINKAINDAIWYQKDKNPKQWLRADLNLIASELASKRFHKSPKINNELLNRIKPSISAVAAQNALLRSMVNKEGEQRLGIDGFPAEGGLFVSLLERSELYAREGNRGWRFCDPKSKKDPYHLFPLWQKTANFLKKMDKNAVCVTKIYDLWSAPPFGLKDGVMPVLMVAFILSKRQKITIYREGVFQARFKDIDVEVLSKNPNLIQLRWMDLSELSRHLLENMAGIVVDLDTENALVSPDPIDVARGLVGIFERLHFWTKRTSQLSSNAIRVRDLFNLAKDPNKFLFEDIPATFGSSDDIGNEKNLKRVVNEVREGLEELMNSYASMMGRLQNLMLAELQVPNMSRKALADLRTRADNIREIGGDFRLNAFVNRLAVFEGEREQIEGIASLAANKPPRDWNDSDLERANIEIADLSQKFIRVENFARVKGRADKRHAIAVVVGVNGRPKPSHIEFEVTDKDIERINDIVDQIENVIDSERTACSKLVLAAFAELSSRYIAEFE